MATVHDQFSAIFPEDVVLRFDIRWLCGYDPQLLLTDQRDFHKALKNARLRVLYGTGRDEETLRSFYNTRLREPYYPERYRK